MNVCNVLTVNELAATIPNIVKPQRPHLPKASPARLARSIALGQIASTVRKARTRHGWSQSEMVNVIREAEGKKPLKPTMKGWVPNGRVSRVEQAKPTTLSNLNGFALAFGYDNVWDWLRAVFAGHQTPRQAHLLEAFQKIEAVAPAQANSLLKMVEATAARLPAPPDRPALSRGRRPRGGPRST